MANINIFWNIKTFPIKALILNLKTGNIARDLDKNFGSPL